MSTNTWTLNFFWNGKTQNQNEHFHSRVWRYCSKYRKPSKVILDFAVAQSILDYNAGHLECPIISDLGEPYTILHESYLKRQDTQREREIVQRKTISRSRESRADYAAGGF